MKLRSPALIWAAHVLCGLALAGCAQTSNKANTQAQSDTQSTLMPLLREVAQAHPDQAAAVNDVLGNWSTRPERQTFNAVKPLLAIEQQDRPDLAKAIDLKLATWDQRLTDFGQ